MRRPSPPVSQVITAGFPRLDPSILTASQIAFLDDLPRDYRTFLETHNGGTVPDFAVEFDTGVPFRTAHVDNPNHDDGVREFYGLRTAPGTQGPPDLLARMREHDQEEFLPSGVVAIAVCASSSLVCVSLRPKDHGAIYYWDWYWRYPWCKWFFEERIAAVSRVHPDADDVLDDRSNTRYQEVADAFNSATIVRLAPSFQAWLSSCYDVREAGEG